MAELEDCSLLVLIDYERVAVAAVLVVVAAVRQAAAVEKGTSKHALKEQLRRLARKGVDSLLEPATQPIEPQEGSQKEVEAKEAGDKEGEAEEQGIQFEGTFAKGAKVRMIEEDDKNKRLLGEVATVEQVLPGNHVMLKFDNALELGVLAGRAMPIELLELAGECKAAPELKSCARVPQLG